MVNYNGVGILTENCKDSEWNKGKVFLIVMNELDLEWVEQNVRGISGFTRVVVKNLGFGAVCVRVIDGRFYGVDALDYCIEHAWMNRDYRFVTIEADCCDVTHDYGSEFCDILSLL